MVTQLKYIFIFIFIAKISAQEDLYDQKLQDFSTKIEQCHRKQQKNKALQLADDALIYAKSLNKPSALLDAYLLQTIALRSNNRLDDALKMCNKALKIADNEGFNKKKATTLLEKAKIFRYKGEKNTAVENLTKSRVIYEKFKDKKGIANVYILYGVLKTELGDYKNGQKYLHDALQYFININDNDRVADTWMAIGYTNFIKKKYPKAKKSFLNALGNISSDNYAGKNMLYLNIATIYQRLSQLDSAYYYQIKAIKNAEKSNDKYLLSTLYFNASTVKFEQKQIDSTKYYAEKGLALSKELKRYNRQIDNLLMLSQVDSVQGNITGELAIFKTIMHLKDAILKQERKNIAEEMETKYSNLKKDEIIALQDNNLSIANEKNKLLSGLIVFAVFSFIISLILLFTYRKLLNKSKKLHQIEKKQLAEQLKNKEKELVAIALQIEQKNTLIDKFYYKLKQATFQSENADKELKHFLSEIKSSVNIQKDIDLFADRFADLHHDFITKLKKQFPELSIKEIKFLSFIKVGLSNKQIASMQNITTSAVHKMRYRIKKKLQLDKDTSIDDFIINL